MRSRIPCSNGKQINKGSLFVKRVIVTAVDLRAGLDDRLLIPISL